MNRIALIFVVVTLGACAAQSRHSATYDSIQAELAKASEQKGKAEPSRAVSDALLPPLQTEMPKAGAKSLEARFDLVVNNAPANQVFMAIVSGTRYSMLVHPEVTGAISVNLKDVSVQEALDAIRELYGYEYKLEGTRIHIQPLTLQIRIFQVNYLMGQRRGRSDVRVSSGSVSDTSGGASSSGAPGTVPQSAGTTGRSIESSRITTSADSDFWVELSNSLKAIIGAEGGRNVVVSPQSGVVVVKALPGELRQVESFLQATQLVVERQVMLEAKILEVQLKDGFETGINWAAFKTGDNSRFAGGLLSPGTRLTPSGQLIGGGVLNIDPATGRSIGNPLISNPASPGNIGAVASATGSLFGLAFQTSNFAALLSFLETQGNVHVLSSPRIAALNNQKAVLKVGTDEFFVTNITTSTTTTATGGELSSNQSPTITVQPFFSGIALDVTPQIDDQGQIILHVHPSVSVVTEKNKTLTLGDKLGTFILPLASSSINESDTVVRVSDGNIVAIGGLMRQHSVSDRSQIPGIGSMPGIGGLFGNTSQSTLKSELVILLKPTVIQDPRGWQQDLQETRERVEHLAPRIPGGDKPQTTER